ncbi:hypothetical protein DAEQUDRAFT_733661 [Daedalea quercina L-15889]|uniref:Uncharacterized protein n=1 Tax=Daedalea quercina L-15889 TaxID=1314783 RepID=A0A165KUA9_9APHY|nr:hypothetical protein DAEQUDRAFT_733661 [Daedalea quercina L-15889]
MSRSSRTMQMSSLDPPGSDRPLTQPFAFTEQKPDRKKLLAAFPYMKPFDTLPRCLIPSRRYAWRPPQMFYSWVAPEDTMMDYARKLGIVKRSGPEVQTLDIVLRRMIAGERVADIN